jgi:hypothetical protein
MARGFESKDVEFQQAEAERFPSTRKALTPAEREAESRRRSIELALANARTQRRAATHPFHRRMLDDAITALQDELSNFPRGG